MERRNEGKEEGREGRRKKERREGTKEVEKGSGVGRNGGVGMREVQMGAQVDTDRQAFR